VILMTHDLFYFFVDHAFDFPKLFIHYNQPNPRNQSIKVVRQETIGHLRRIQPDLRIEIAEERRGSSNKQSFLTAFPMY
jgi:hypothetical protein